MEKQRNIHAALNIEFVSKAFAGCRVYKLTTTDPLTITTTKKTGLVVNGFVCHFITSPMDMMTSLLMHTWNHGCGQAATMWTEYTADIFSWIVECK